MTYFSDRIYADIFTSMKSNGILQSHLERLSRDSDLRCNNLEEGSVAIVHPLIASCAELRS